MAMRRKALLLLVAHALLIVGGGRPGVTQFDRYLEKHGLPRPCLILYHVGKAGGETLHQWFPSRGLKLWTHYGSAVGKRADIFTQRGDRGPYAPGRAPFVWEADVIMGHFRPESAEMGKRQSSREVREQGANAKWPHIAR